MRSTRPSSFAVSNFKAQLSELSEVGRFRNRACQKPKQYFAGHFPAQVLYLCLEILCGVLLGHNETTNVGQFFTSLGRSST